MDPTVANGVAVEDVVDLAVEHVLIVAKTPAQGHVRDVVAAPDRVHTAVPILVVGDVIAQTCIKMTNAQIKEINDPWQSGVAKNITFIVTKDCQLACKYCYLVGKNSNERMSWETAKVVVDYVLSHDSEFPEDAVIWDFIGGDPLLEIDLIDKVCDYIKTEMYRLNHRWFNSYRFSFTTNGINYHHNKVQNFLHKNKEHISIAITIDGTKRKHDLNRIWNISGIEKGSYDDIIDNIHLWLRQFPNAGTKVTVSSEDIPYIRESVLHLYSLGIKEVNINVVFENCWKEGDDRIFENQLLELADAIIDNNYYETFACSFFNDQIGKPISIGEDNRNWCGAGKMLAIDATGNFYPCNRFTQFSLRSKQAITIGSVKDGIDQNKLRPFLTLDRTTQSPQECIDCEVASGCAWCQGENYDAADTPTVYQRSTAICKMHKARVRANNYYWNKLFRKLELEGRAEEFEELKKKSSNTAELC